jgi:hypothetical protein
MRRAAPWSEEGIVKGFMIFCPGCKCGHLFHIPPHKNSSGASWSFNGNLERPTFTPSMLVRSEWDSHENLTEDDYTPWVDEGNGTRGRKIKPESMHNLVHHKEVCHSFVRDGQMQFLCDCTHALRGMTVTLEDFDK